MSKWSKKMYVMSLISKIFRIAELILKPRMEGYYRRLFYKGFPKTFVGRFLVLIFIVAKRFLRIKYLALPLGIQKKVIIPLNKSVKDFDEALIYVYFGAMYNLIKFKTPKNSICVDVGAHYGFWTFKMADKCKLVIALEPAPTNFTILYNSIVYSGLRNVVALPFAAGEALYESFIVKPKGGTDEFWHISSNIIDAQEVYPVKIIPLDRLLDILTSGQIDIMKIDVEGFEVNVLNGLRGKLSKGLIRVITLEVHSPLLLRIVLKIFQEYSYNVKVFKIKEGLYEVYAYISS
jgi:FkbM family methyltransferase